MWTLPMYANGYDRVFHLQVRGIEFAKPENLKCNLNCSRNIRASHNVAKSRPSCVLYVAVSERMFCV